MLLGFAVPAPPYGRVASGRVSAAVSKAPFRTGTGALVPGAKISVTSQDTGVTKQYISDNHGEYIANLLPPGTYKVEVSAAGFRTTVSTGNVVTVDGVTRVDVTLQLGAATESVEVTGDNPWSTPPARRWARC